jgi:hypothetical protein
VTFVPVAGDNQTETETLQIVSEYSKPLLGDLLITFNQETQTDNNTKQLPTGEFVLVILILVASVAASIYVMVRRRRQPKIVNKKK